MSSNPDVIAIFSAFQQYLDKEKDFKEEIKTLTQGLDQKRREMVAVMQAVHQPGTQNVVATCKRAREMFVDVRAEFALLKEKISQDDYYRLYDQFRWILQGFAFLASLIVFLETGSLIERQECAQIVGVCVRREEGFHMDIEDYLQGLLSMANELSRLSVNAVTGGDYARPRQISSFLGDLDSGFRLLNLKNDALRKRFDCLKYDIQKVEGVVYDVEIRGLGKPETAQPETKAT